MSNETKNVETVETPETVIPTEEIQETAAPAETQETVEKAVPVEAKEKKAPAKAKKAKEEKTAPADEFDWDAYEKGETFSGISKEELTKTYDETLNKINDNEVVVGHVTSMNKREVVINIGYKSDGVVPMNEFRYNPDLKVGDEVEVYIESQEDKKGQLLLSHKKAVSSSERFRCTVP